MAEAHPYYLVWSGALNMGDTPGVFMDAQFVGLLLQIPVTITFLPDGSDQVKFLLMTTEVEIFNGKQHPVYWDWSPGAALPTPVGFIDDTYGHLARDSEDAIRARLDARSERSGVEVASSEE